MIPAHEIKRQILKSSGTSVIKQRMDNQTGISTGEMIEVGNELDRTVKTNGWGIIENYMLKKMNLVNLAVSDTSGDIEKGVAKAFIELMQWIHLTIERRNKLLEEERLNYEAKNVPKDETEQGE